MRPNIYYNGKRQGYINKDQRFNDQEWFWNSKDIRINRCRRKVGYKVKFSTVLWIIFWIALVVICQQVDNGRLVPKNDKVSVITTPIQVKAASEPSKAPKSVEQMIRDKFGSAGDKAVRVAYCESRLDPKKINWNDGKYHSVGLFQINLVPERGLTIEQMQDPQENIDYAFHLYQKHNGFTRDWVYCGRK